MFGNLTILDRAVRACEMYLNFVQMRVFDRDYDEVSLIVNSQPEMDALLHQAHSQGLWFNNSVERQLNLKTKETYVTDYQFVWPREESDWRIELMRVTEGRSVAHDFLREFKQFPCVAHVSYKLKNVKEYNEEKKILLKQEGLMSAELENDYGRFAYFPHFQDDSLQVFIKPRINLRDRGKKR